MEEKNRNGITTLEKSTQFDELVYIKSYRHLLFFVAVVVIVTVVDVVYYVAGKAIVCKTHFNAPRDILPLEHVHVAGNLIIYNNVRRERKREDGREGGRDEWRGEGDGGSTSVKEGEECRSA